MTDPRVVRSRATVLEATTALLAERGIDATSIEAIAERSGVAKTTIYRHWPGKAALVVDAIDALAGPVVDPDTGSLAGDLRALARGLAAGLAAGPWADVLPSLIGALQRDPELAARHRETTDARHRVVRSIVARARARGEIEGRISDDDVIALVAGPLFHRRLVEGQGPDRWFADRIVDHVLDLARGR